MSTTCACGGACAIPQNTLLELRWDDYTRCSSLARPADRKLCKLAHVLKENPMPTKRTEDDDLVEQLRPHMKKPEHGVAATGVYQGLRQLGWSHTASAKGAVHAISHAPTTEGALSEESAAQSEERDLAAAIAEVADAVADATIRASVASGFRNKYDELRAKMGAARARREAALYAQSEAERLIASGLGAHRDDDAVDEYLTASEKLASATATRQRRCRPGRDTV